MSESPPKGKQGIPSSAPNTRHAMTAKKANPSVPMGEPEEPRRDIVERESEGLMAEIVGGVAV